MLTKYELEDVLEKSKRRPKFFALRLAEKLFGLEVLIKSTPYGIGGKAALNPVILDAIKCNKTFLCFLCCKIQVLVNVLWPYATKSCEFSAAMMLCVMA